MKLKTIFILQIICSFSIIFVDIHNAVRMHYLPYFFNNYNTIIRNEMRKIISILSPRQEYMLFLDFVLLLIASVWTLKKSQKKICYIFAFCITVRFLYLGYDYMNILLLYKKDSIAVDIIIKGWVKYYYVVTPIIVTMLFLLYNIYDKIIQQSRKN